MCKRGVLLSVTTGKETKQRRIYCTREDCSPKMAKEGGFKVRQCQHIFPSKVSLNTLLRISKLTAMKKAGQRGTGGTSRRLAKGS